MFEIVDVDAKSFVMPLKITEQEKAKAVKKLIGKLLASIVHEIRKINKPDHFYSVKASGWKFFVAQKTKGIPITKQVAEAVKEYLKNIKK